MVAPGPIVKARVGRLLGPQTPEKVPSLRIRQKPVVTVRVWGFSMLALGRDALDCGAPNRSESAAARRKAVNRFKNRTMITLRELQFYHFREGFAATSLATRSRKAHEEVTSWLLIARSWRTIGKRK